MASRTPGWIEEMLDPNKVYQGNLPLEFPGPEGEPVRSVDQPHLYMHRAMMEPEPRKQPSFFPSAPPKRDA